MNCVLIKGNLVRDAERSYSRTSNKAIVKFSVAYNQYKKKGDEWETIAHYFEVTYIGDKADRMFSQLVKGAGAVVSGSLQQERWQKDGQNCSKVTILADEVSICQKTDKAQMPSSESQAIPSDAQADSQSEFPEDIPF